MQSTESTKPKPEVTIVTVLFNGDNDKMSHKSKRVYGPRYVNYLYQQTRKHCTIPFRFLVLQDADYNYAHPEIEGIRLDNPGRGWMNLMEVYRPDIGIDNGLFVALDTIFIKNINEIATLCDDKGVQLGIGRLDKQGGLLMNPLICFKKEMAKRMWDEFSADPEGVMERCDLGNWRNFKTGWPSELEFLRQFVPRELTEGEDWVDISKALPNRLLSWKLHMQEGQTPPRKDTSVIFFHGEKKPHELTGKYSNLWKCEE